MQKELFPREVTSNVPRITLTGREQVHVEQHRGLIAYNPEEIILRTSVGLLRMTGQNLRFSLYSAGEALIVGQIASVEYASGEGRP